MKLSKKNVAYLATVFVVIYPIIFRYRSFISAITFGEIIGFFILVVCLFFLRGKMYIDKSVLLFALCFFGRSIISLALGESGVGNAVGTGLRLTVLYLFILMFENYFDYNYAKKVINIVAVIIVIYELIQVVFSFKGIYLTTSLPFLKEIRDTDAEILAKAQLGIRFRPCAVFGEPGELGAYLVLPLAINLLEEKTTAKDKYWLMRVLLFTVGLIATLSSTGTVMAIFVWMLFFLKRNTSYNIKILLIVLGIAGLIVGAQMGVWQYFVLRLFGGSGLTGIAGSTHFRDIPRAFSDFDNLIYILIGRGMKDPNGFLSGLPRLLYWLGMIGFAAFIHLMIREYNKGKKTKRNLIYIWLVINIAGSYLIGAFALPYMAFILGSDTKKTLFGDQVGVI